MNKLIACVGVAAVGASAVEAQSLGEPTVSKPWSVSAKIRGFYDDNYATAPDNPSPGYPQKEASWGVNVAPSVGLSVLRDVTTMSVKYDFDLRWYEARTDNEFDATHKADLNLGHAFSDRFRVDLIDSFAYSSEPEVIEPMGQQATYLRTDDSNLRNYAGVNLTASMTDKFGTGLGYSNTLYDYENDWTPVLNDGTYSRSALLDRMEHLANIDLRWLLQPVTTGLVGYQFGATQMSSQDMIDEFGHTGDYRDNYTHTMFLGLNHSFSPRFSLQLRGGMQYVDFINADETEWLPYGDASLSYQYAEGSQVKVGIKHDVRMTDVTFVDPATGQPTLGQEATTVYAAIVHRITNRLIGMLRGQWQGSSYIQGFYDGDQDNFWLFDANLTYEFNAYFAAEAGYAYDNLDSDIPNRGYDRNRFYFGVRAKF